MISRSFLFATVASIALAAPAIAQDEPVVTEDASGERVFVPADFERFAPRNALDIVRQIPGFSIRSGGGDRGLGQADTNVLINGQRISGKSNGPVEALQRIPVEDVVRLEILDGASLDIGGLSGQVLNVITRSTGGVTGQFRYSAEWRSFGVPFRWGDGQVSLAGGGDSSEWTLSLENDAGRQGNQGIEQVFDADGLLIDERDEIANFNSDRTSLSGSYGRTADNGNILNLNARVESFINRNREVSLRSGLVSSVDRNRIFRSTEDEYNFELGGDYAFDLAGGTLKLIGFHRYEDSPTLSEVTTVFADDRSLDGSLFVRDADEGETIARGEYGFSALGGDVQLALEGVKNFLEIDSALEVRDDLGTLQPIAFDGASARVEEDRAEASVTYGRALAPNVQAQFSLGGEYSRISQSGELGLTRTFWRPKGFVSLDWKASDKLSLSGKIERVVGQLNFFDFIASTNLNEGRVNVTNANLVPPQTWLFEAEAVRSLGALGSVNLRGYYETISDFIDQIPIEGGGEAPGNVDNATVKGVSGEATILFDPLGAKGLRLDAEAQYGESNLLDPFLGTPREISDYRYFVVEVELRKDFIGTDWAIGGAYRKSNRRPDVRLFEISQRYETNGFLRAFVENKDVLGMTARLRVANLLDQRDRFDRVVFVDRRAGEVDFREFRDRKFGTIFSFDLEGSF